MIARQAGECPRCMQAILPGMPIKKPFRERWIHSQCERETERAYRRGWGPGTWKKAR